MGSSHKLLGHDEAQQVARGLEPGAGLAQPGVRAQQHEHRQGAHGVQSQLVEHLLVLILVDGFGKLRERLERSAQQDERVDI